VRNVSLFLSIGLIVLLVGCGQSSMTTPQAVNSTSQVSLSMTDDPPNGVTVLFFQINLTAANLTPASSTGTGTGTVSLLNNNTPVQVDVTELQAISAFLSAANVPAGTYNSLILTFANPQLVIFNEADQSIASTCAVGSVCQITPQIDNSATLTFSSSPFPVMVSQNMPLGFLVDFHLNKVIQDDLSVNLGATNGVTVEPLPPAPPSGHAPFGFVKGTVQSVTANQNQFTLQTRDGRTFTIDVNSSTTYGNFPTSACMTPSLMCVATGQTVKVEVASVQSPGTLLAAEVDFVQAASQQEVEGNIIGLNTANGSTVMTLLLHWSPDAGRLPFGGVATVTVSSSATFSVDSGTFTIPSGLSFASATDLLVGQAVQVDVVAGSLSSATNSPHWAPPSVSFTTDSVELEPSQITGMVTAVDSSTSAFTITTFPFFFPMWSSGNWMPDQITVDTTSQTTYENLNPDSFAGVMTNTMVSTRGWLFSTPSGATPSTMVGEKVVGRMNGFF
jgi:hypothetical protein